jgi:hypothetical protein
MRGGADAGGTARTAADRSLSAAAVAGEEKVGALRKLLARDPSIPAGRVEPGGDSLILADRAAAPDA